MARVSGTTSILTNASSGNVLSGKQIEIPTRVSVARIAAAAAATGILGTVFAGARTLMEESHISPANRFPVFPDDVAVQDVVAPNERLSLTFRNTTGGTVIVQWAVDVNEVG